MTSASSRAVLTRLNPAVPPALAERAASWPGENPVEPALAASVVLLRDAEPGLETYLLHRHERMPFAASMVVFPGGRVDPVDLQAPHPLRACAVRETQEETGVRLREADLHDWAHWITPEFEPRRYDTRFFVGAMPPGQAAWDISGETNHAEWSTPSHALAAERLGEIALMPPTLSILLELADLNSVADVLQAAGQRVVEPVLPRLVQKGGKRAFDYSPVRPATHATP